jgi:vacuolar-type H+-ATPase subunit E/Vma4
MNERKTPMRKTTMKTTPKNHDADVIADAQAHAAQIAQDQVDADAEDEALRARGRAVDAAEAEKRAKADRAKHKAVEQFAGVLAALRLRDAILYDIRVCLHGRSVRVTEVIDKMMYLGHDPELVGVVIGETFGLEIKDGYLRERR